MSLSANCACQFSAMNVRPAGERPTDAFHWVQERSVVVITSSWPVAKVLVHTDVGSGMCVVMAFWHEVSPVFVGPSGWAVIPGGYHDLGVTWRNVTHGTRCVMIMEAFLKRVDKLKLILSAVDVCCSLDPVPIAGVIWSVMETDVGGATTRLTMFSTADYSFNREIVF